MPECIGALEVAYRGAVRINSDVITWPVRDGGARREKVPAANGQSSAPRQLWVYGVEKDWRQLIREGIEVGRDRVARLT